MVRRSTRPNRVQLSVIELEGRNVPAGDVTASLAFFELDLVGDDAANSVRIVVNDTGAIITGVDGTTVNGVSEVSFPGVNALIRVATGSGDDSIDVEYAGYAYTGYSELLISTGNGDDEVSLNLTPSGNGALISHFPFVAVDTGNGKDQVALAFQSNPDGTLSFLRFLSISTGQGDDSVTLSGSFDPRPIDSSIEILLGQGNDLLDVQLPPRTTPSFFTHVAVDGGAGEDRLINAEYFTNFQMGGVPLYTGFELFN